MIDALINLNLTGDNIGHHVHCNMKSAGWGGCGGGRVMRLVGGDAYANPVNPLGRHPFNIITEEIYDIRNI